MIIDFVMVAGNKKSSSMYHERQMKELCALHALNNLFQEKKYNKQELDDICYNLSPNVWINPHKSVLGLGNYDINVMMAALQKKGYEAVWFDKRRDPECLHLDNIKGFILNIPTEYKLGFVLLPLKRRHWVALKKIQGSFYNLDSKLDAPLLIGDDSNLIAYIKEQIQSKEKELFLVVSQEIDKNQGWLAEPSETKVSTEQTEASIAAPKETVIHNTNTDLNLNNSEGVNVNGNLSNDQSIR